MTERWLRRAGFEVTVAASGAEAVTCASKESFDFLVSDLVMPGTPGREVAEEIDQRMPDIRVLFISGYLADGHLPDAQFLAKPFDRRTFLAKLRSAPPLQRVPQSSGSPPPGGAPPEDPHDGDDGDGGGAAPLAAVPVFDDATRAAIQRTLERAHRDPN